MNRTRITWATVGMALICSTAALAEPQMSEPISGDSWGPFVVYKNLAQLRIGSTPGAYGDWEIGLRDKGGQEPGDNPFKPKVKDNNYIWPNDDDPNTWVTGDPNNFFTLTFTKATGTVEFTLDDAPTLSYDYKEYTGRGMDKLYLMAKVDTRESEDPNDTYTCLITDLQINSGTITDSSDLLASCSNQSTINTYATISGLDCNDFTLTGNIIFGWTAVTAPKGSDIEVLTAFGKAGLGPDIVIDGIISPGEWYGKEITAVERPDPNQRGSALKVYACADPNLLRLAYSVSDDSTDARNDPNHQNDIDQLSVYIGLLGRVGAYRYCFDSVVNAEPNHQMVEIIDGYKCWWTESDDSQIGDPVWGPIGTDAPIPDGIEYLTSFNSARRVSEISIPMSALVDDANSWDIEPGVTLRIGGTVTNDYEPNMFVYPEGLLWPDPNTYQTLEVSPFPSTDIWSLLDRASIVELGPDSNPWVIKLESISAEAPPWASVMFLPPTEIIFSELGTLSADYNMTFGSFGGGSPRFSLLIDWNDSGTADEGDKYAFVYWGTYPDFNDTPTPDWHNTGNLYDSTDLRVDLSQFGGASYSTIDDANVLFGNKKICEVILFLDGSWMYDQVLLVDNITVGDYVYDAVPLWDKISGDLNDDNTVNIDDLVIMLRNWLRDDCQFSSCEGADIASPHDGAVNLMDYAALSKNLFVPFEWQIDTDPPQPNPMIWVSAPEATGPNSITMTAAVATDENEVEYYFQNVTNPTHNSNWQDSPIYIDTGLEPLTEYIYRVKARDKTPNRNENLYSAPASATTRNPDVDEGVEGIFISVASQDGRVWNGGSSPRFNNVDQGDEALRLGDYYDTIIESVGYRTILSFDTSSLPKNCTITSVKLEMTRGAEMGENPFIWGGGCNVDIRKPYFSTSPSLQNADWAAAPSAAAVASFAADPGADLPMTSTEFNAQGLININLDGTTQLRVYFTTPTYNGTSSDYLGFYSGNTPPPEYILDPDLRPKLIIRYTTPTRTPTVTFTSVPEYDGRVWNEGYRPRYNNFDTNGKALRLGDYYDTTVLSVGYRTILSLDTSSLPDDRLILSANLQLTRGAEEGDNPFTWGGSCNVDISSPYFGSGTSLEDDDWTAAADAIAVASFAADPGHNLPMTSTDFNTQGLDNINKIGTTQLRVYFTTPTYNETNSDYLGFYSGEYEIEIWRPKFIIQYSID